MSPGKTVIPAFQEFIRVTVSFFLKNFKLYKFDCKTAAKLIFSFIC